MKYVIIIAGHIAALKSETARRLGEDLGIITLQRYELKDYLAKSYVTHTDKNIGYLNYSAFKLMRDLMRKILSVNHTLILESDFVNPEIERILSVCFGFDCQPMIIFLTGDEQVLYQRFVERNNKLTGIHKIRDILCFEDYLAKMRKIKPEEYRNIITYVDTTTFSEDDYQALKQEISDRLV